jgi:magnesium transporter
MVDDYRPEVEQLEDSLAGLENEVFEKSAPDLIRRILEKKRDVASLRRVVIPQRDIVGRLARREFVDVSSDMALAFRDVYDHLVRFADEAFLFQDRITGLLEAHLSNVNTRLNEIVKVLTVLTTIFMPLTVLTGLWGMNVPLPRFPWGDVAQFWWVVGVMAVSAVSMLALFRFRGWL